MFKKPLAPSPNFEIVPFDGTRLVPPAIWKSHQARRLYEAGAQARRSDRWPSADPSQGAIRVAPTPDASSCMSPISTTADDAAARARRHISMLRAEADKLERQLAAYGGGVFVVRYESIAAPARPVDAEEFLLGRVLRRAWDRIFVSGVEFRRGRGNVVEQIVETPAP